MDNNFTFSWRKIGQRSLIFIPIAILGFIIFPAIGGPPLFVLFGISTPTGGITRALSALVRFDFTASLNYHLFAIPITLVFIFALFHDLLPVSKKTANIIFITTGIVAFLYHLWRI